VSPVSAAPDIVQRIFNLHQQLWIIKQYTSEVWYDTGTSPSVGFPFSRMNAAVIDYGTPAPWSCARGNNGLFFLAWERDNDGVALIGVVQIQQFTPQLITPPPIVYIWSQYAYIADAFGYCYSDAGHTFYVLTFPTANATWVYDATTGMWHERSTYSGTPYTVSRHYGNCYVNYNGSHLLGDYLTGNIYYMSQNLYQDNGNPLIAVRTCQPVFEPKDNKAFSISRLMLDMELGGSSLVSNPVVSCSFSSDGGHTYSKQYPRAIGGTGSRKYKVTWKRLGWARDKTFKFVISDPVKRVIMGAYIE
jgi:hypothetical protein